MRILSKPCITLLICIAATQVLAAAEPAATLKLVTAQSYNSGKPATEDKNQQKSYQNEMTVHKEGNDERPLLPQRPDDFNPMALPSTPDLNGGDAQSVNAPGGVSAIYMAQLAGNISQLAFFMRGMLAGVILLIFVLLATALYLRSSFVRARESAEAALMETQRARHENASLRRWLRSAISTKPGDDFPDDDVTSV